jgi:hypothetical protein
LTVSPTGCVSQRFISIAWTAKGSRHETRRRMDFMVMEQTQQYVL